MQVMRRKVLPSGSANNWWLRSPNVSNSNNFRYINSSGNYGEINVFAKGAHDLSVRINKYPDVVDRTLLALPLIVVQRFNGRYYGQSELHDDKQVVRGNTSNEQQRTA